ncbi:hypothetical protein [Mycobacterium sp. P7213]|uniref:hypothetical protein n=1 Tax=Mycobacterium sp. P7213 TaxID=2478465 RepID=UPI000F6297FC|nr:hypothetical protein [Mycobacterium sp. P7213]
MSAGLIPNTVPNVSAVSREDGSRYPVAAWGPEYEPWAVGRAGLFEADGETFYLDTGTAAAPVIPAPYGYAAMRLGSAVKYPVVGWDLNAGEALVTDTETGRVLPVSELTGFTGLTTIYLRIEVDNTLDVEVPR